MEWTFLEVESCPGRPSLSAALNFAAVPTGSCLGYEFICFIMNHLGLPPEFSVVPKSSYQCDGTWRPGRGLTCTHVAPSLRTSAALVVWRKRVMERLRDECCYLEKLERSVMPVGT